MFTCRLALKWVYFSSACYWERPNYSHIRTVKDNLSLGPNFCLFFDVRIMSDIVPSSDQFYTNLRVVAGIVPVKQFIALRQGLESHGGSSSIREYFHIVGSKKISQYCLVCSA